MRAPLPDPASPPFAHAPVGPPESSALPSALPSRPPAPPAPFDQLARSCAAAQGGYAWWYVEAHDQAEGRYGLTLIVFAGSVFSPHYAQRLRRGQPACGLSHPAVHFALYERQPGKPCLSQQRLWVMNEYPASAFSEGGSEVKVGRTRLRYHEAGVDIDIDEDTTRFFGKPGDRLRASLRVRTPLHIGSTVAPFPLGENAAGEAHFWQPIAPAATVDVELSCAGRPLRFSGHAYCDRNCGSGRLEATFRRWSWAHGVTAAAQPEALVLYQAQRLDDSVLALAVRYPSQPAPAEFGGARIFVDEHSGWGGSGGGRTDFLWLRVPSRFQLGPYRAERLRSGRLEDAPFYARYAATLSAAADGPAASPPTLYHGVGEYLDLARFRSPAVQRLLTYKTRVVDAVTATPP